MTSTPGIAGPPGRREANKQATRQALQDAADRMFAERGFTATTVRDIALAAGVTERTFFRYFGSKQELILEDTLAWIPVLADMIRDRPAAESPVDAMRNAVHDISALLQETDRPYPLWMFSEGPPGPRMNRVSRGTPGAMLRLEATVTAAIRARLDRSGNPSGIDSGFLADLLGRTMLALVRSIMIRGAQVQADGSPPPDALAGALIDQAFAIVTIPTPAR
jgi:AcrR family transcriptional regulator